MRKRRQHEVCHPLHGAFPGGSEGMQTRQRDQSHTMHSVLLIAPRTIGATQVKVGSLAKLALNKTSLQPVTRAERTPQACFVPSADYPCIQSQPKRLRFSRQGAAEKLAQLATRAMQARLQRASRDA